MANFDASNRVDMASNTIISESASPKFPNCNSNKDTLTDRGLAGMGTDGAGRQWLYPREVKGSFVRWRTAVAWILLVALFAGPFLSIDGHALFLFNVMERKFIFFGVPFWPQDFYLVAFGLIVAIVFVSLFTVVYGRVWCGWVCPQTIFMEMVFRKIEIWIEGDFSARKRLDAAPWTLEKVSKKALKHTIFFLLAFVISNTFLAYIIGKEALFAIITDDVTKHWGGLAAILLFTGVFYAVFAWIREIVCTTICPYGRLQSVLLDRSSIVVAYDYVRGEPRGKRKKDEMVASKGDCIDCGLCVQVCPTGIDIRKGTQMECINCTACIDACNPIMAKLNRPKDLIRFDSQAGIEEKQPLGFTSRMKAYSVVLAVLAGVLIFLLVSRPQLEATVLRAPGQLYQREANGYVSNLYTIELVNKTFQDLPVSLRIKHPKAQIHIVQPLTHVPANELAKSVFFISLPSILRETSTPLEIEIHSGNGIIERVKTTFLGPVEKAQ